VSGPRVRRGPVDALSLLVPDDAEPAIRAALDLERGIADVIGVPA
jgi:hypothetical protein